MTAAVEDFVHAGYDLNAEAILLCESDGTEQEVEDEIQRMSDVLRAAGATAIAVSKDEAERLRFWSVAKMRFQHQVGSAQTTCAWTPPSPANGWPTFSWPLPRWRKNTSCVVPTCPRW